MAETLPDTFPGELAARLGEPVQHAQRFFPADRQLRPERWRPLLRRLRGQARLDDRLPSFAVAVLAVSATRVGVFETSTRSGAFALTDPFAIWVRGEVTGTAERLELDRASYSVSAARSTRVHSVKVLRLRLETPDGPLWADLPTGRESTALADSLK